MLNDYLTADTVRFVQNVDGWREAIDLVTAPLLESGAITPEYVEAITTSIGGGGVYIDLGFGIALAHSRPENGVRQTGLSSLRVRPAVLLNDDPAHPIDLFFCLAATDKTSHLETMGELASLLGDEELRAQLLEAHSSADALAVIHKMGNGK